MNSAPQTDAPWHSLYYTSYIGFEKPKPNEKNTEIRSKPHPHFASRPDTAFVETLNIRLLNVTRTTIRRVSVGEHLSVERHSCYFRTVMKQMFCVRENIL
jgi:hypothetical protein